MLRFASRNKIVLFNETQQLLAQKPDSSNIGDLNSNFLLETQTIISRLTKSSLKKFSEGAVTFCQQAVSSTRNQSYKTFWSKFTHSFS
jgi:hypothetical protein